MGKSKRGMVRMMRRMRLTVLLVAAMVVFPMAAFGGEEEVSFYPASFTSAMVTDKIIDIDIDHRGVKLGAITFSGNEALLTVWNRSPNRVKANAAVALFDQKNRLIAAESDSKAGGVGAGKQGNFKINFKKFLSDFSGISHFHLVFVIQESES
jgi:hypothetical protein